MLQAGCDDAEVAEPSQPPGFHNAAVAMILAVRLPQAAEQLFLLSQQRQKTFKCR